MYVPFFLLYKKKSNDKRTVQDIQRQNLKNLSTWKEGKNRPKRDRRRG